jgi:hypothetical protein
VWICAAIVYLLTLFAFAARFLRSPTCAKASVGKPTCAKASVGKPTY